MLLQRLGRYQKFVHGGISRILNCGKKYEVSNSFTGKKHHYTTSVQSLSPKIATGEHYHDMSKLMQHKYSLQIMEWIDPQPGDQIIDAGCGPGKLVELLAEKVGPTGSVIGFDPDPERIGVARKKNDHLSNTEFHVCTSDMFPWRQFVGCDHVVSNFVTHWMSLEEKKRFLRNVHKTLRNGGLFASCQPYDYCSNTRHIAETLGFKALFTRFTFHQEEWFTHHLQEAGFKVVRCEQASTYLELGTQLDYLKWMSATFGTLDFDCEKENEKQKPSLNLIKSNDGTVLYENKTVAFLAKRVS